MKKYLFLASVAALSFTACTNETEEYVGAGSADQQKEIAFFAVNQAATKGAVTTATFPTEEKIKASALDLTNHRQFFEPTTFKYNGTTHLWEGETDHRYWPLSEVQVNFLAIALENVTTPASDIAWTTTGTQSSEVQSVQVAQADNYSTSTAQKDFMYAIGNGQVTRNGNILSFPTKVDMTFKHAQAYMVFNAKAADEASENITIKNILINGARTSGTATIARANAGTYADENINLNWTSTGYPGGGTAVAYNSVTPTQAAFSPAQEITDDDYTEIGHLMVVPNMSDVNTYANGGFTSIKIVYTLGGNDYEYVYTPAAADTKLKAGYKYVYNITFKLHEIVIDPVVTVWDTDVNDDDIANDDVNILIPSVAYNESGADVYIGATAGTYTFTISNVPATGGETYSVVEKDAAGDTDFITSVSQTNDATSGAKGNMVITVVTTAGANDAHRAFVIKLGSTEKMVVTLTKKTSV